MKLLGNPWIVGGLCVIAAGVVGYQYFPHHGQGLPTAVPQTGAGMLAAPAVPGPAAQVSPHAISGTNAPASVSLIDRAYVESHFPQWLQAPQRDPFLLSLVANFGGASGGPLSRWKLKSIWRQTGSRLAVINQKLYAEGDQIEGYELQAIESDRVWFQGPTGRVSLSFTTSTPTNAIPLGTNAPASK